MDNATNSEDDVARMAYINIYSYFHNTYIWVLVILGVPGNVASVLTILTMPFTASIFYVALLAVTDLLALVLKVVFHQMYNYGVPVSTAGCKVEVLVEVVSSYANWTLVLICFERFLTVCYPQKKAVCFTKKKAAVMAAALWVALLLCYMYAVVVKEKGDNSCQFPEYSRSSILPVWYWITVCLYSFLPFTILVIFTSLTIVGYRKQTTALRTSLKTSAGDDDEDDDSQPAFVQFERTVSIMLVSYAVVFLVLTFPTCVYYLMLAFGQHRYGTLEESFASVMFAEVSVCLADATHAVNFYIYFLSARRFRARFKDLVRTYCLCQAVGSVHSRTDYELHTTVTQ